MKRGVSWLSFFLKSPKSKSVIVVTDAEKIYWGGWGRIPVCDQPNLEASSR